MTGRDVVAARSLGPPLAALAERLGIESSYWDLLGEAHATSPATARALCAAMGFEAESDERAAESLERLDRSAAQCCIAPGRVWREHARRAPDLPVRHPGGSNWRVQLRIVDEGGGRRESEGRLPDVPADRAVVIPLPGPLAPGRHDIELSLTSGREERHARQRLVVAPRTALRFSEKLGDRRVAGFWTNLYSLRSSRSWGFGDAGDLDDLAHACSVAGGDFVGVNPLHAVPVRHGGVSPYSPVSRLFRSPLYIDVESVPELLTCDSGRRLLESAVTRATLATLRAADQLDGAAVWALKAKVLRELHRAFQTSGDPERRARFDAFRRDGGSALLDFATFQVLTLEGPGRDGSAWQRWPAELRDPSTRAVAGFREQHAEAVDFQLWLQFELDQQLAAVARTCREGGQAIGLYFDLAVGSARDSADTWTVASRYARDVSLGAPPDAYAPQGQVWGLPPFDPIALRREGFEAWQELLNASLRHAGALRIDHVMGLQRQFWVPDGGTPADGAYVRFPVDELLGIAALESRRHDALVIGEDLGTVPPGLVETLASWGILSSSVFVFERRGPAFPTPSQLSSRALASIGTHDLAPLAGYVAGRDLELQRLAGTLASQTDLEEAQAERNGERTALEDRLRAEGLVGEGEPSPQAFRRGLNELLGRSPAALVGISLDDVAGEREPINLPGIPIDVHPSWTRRMTTPLDCLLEPEALREELPRCRRRSDPGPAR